MAPAAARRYWPVEDGVTAVSVLAALAARIEAIATVAGMVSVDQAGALPVDRRSVPAAPIPSAAAEAIHSGARGVFSATQRSVVQPGQR